MDAMYVLSHSPLLLSEGSQTARNKHRRLCLPSLPNGRMIGASSFYTRFKQPDTPTSCSVSTQLCIEVDQPYPDSEGGTV